MNHNHRPAQTKSKSNELISYTNDLSIIIALYGQASRLLCPPRIIPAKRGSLFQRPLVYSHIDNTASGAGRFASLRKSGLHCLRIKYRGLNFRLPEISIDVVL
jgi:hypothetical protein